MKLKFVALSLVLVTIMWGIMFGPAPLNFWLMMTTAQCIMITIAWRLRPDLKKALNISWKEAGWGAASAAVLYGLFVVAHRISTEVFDFAGEQISSIYAIRDQGEALVIGLLLLLVIGPGEEIYWRGLVQHAFTKKWGRAQGLLATTVLYSAVHVAAANFMLFGAAAVCGLFWGLLYVWRRSLFACILSHAIWDVVVMVLFPIT